MVSPFCAISNGSRSRGGIRLYGIASVRATAEVRLQSRWNLMNSNQGNLSTLFQNHALFSKRTDLIIPL